MMRSLGIMVALTLALGSVPPVAAAAAPRADEADAAYVRSVVGRAAAHVEAGRYAQALAVLDEAERTRPHAVFVYVRATIEERRGDCERAAALYLRFLELDVPESDAEDARNGVARCRGEQGPAAGSGAAPSVEPPEPAVADPPADEPSRADVPPARPWYADPWGGALVATGAVGLGVGTGLVARSRVDARAAADATSLQIYDDRSQRAVALDRAGIVTIAVGSALLAAGIVRYALLVSRDRKRLALAPGPLRRGAGLRLTVRF